MFYYNCILVVSYRGIQRIFLFSHVYSTAIFCSALGLAIINSSQIPNNLFLEFDWKLVYPKKTTQLCGDHTNSMQLLTSSSRSFVQILNARCFGLWLVVRGDPQAAVARYGDVPEKLASRWMGPNMNPKRNTNCVKDLPTGWVLQTLFIWILLQCVIFFVHNPH